MSRPSATKLVVHLVSARSEEAFVTRKVFEHATSKTWDNPTMLGRVSYQSLSLEPFRIYLSFPADQGGDFAMSHLKDCLHQFKPDLCIMTGICAGQRGKVNLGDVIVATRAFDYMRGRRSDGGFHVQPILFASDHLDAWIPWVQATMSTKNWASNVRRSHIDDSQYKRYELSPVEFLQRAIYEYQNGVERSKWLWAHGFDRSKSLPENKGRIPDYDESMRELVVSRTARLENFQLQLSEDAYNDIKKSIAVYGEFFKEFPPQFADDRAPMKPKVHYGVYASGSSVRSDTYLRKYRPSGNQDIEAEEKISQCFKEAIEQYRDTMAVDMECAAFYQTLQGTDIRGICVKGVSDYGDHEKDDQVHEYAKKTAASYAWELIKAYYDAKTEELQDRYDLSRLQGRHF